MVKAVIDSNCQKQRPGVKSFIQGPDVRKQKTEVRRQMEAVGSRGGANPRPIDFDSRREEILPLNFRITVINFKWNTAPAKNKPPAAGSEKSNVL
jgi:hypothetical protein